MRSYCRIDICLSLLFAAWLLVGCEANPKLPLHTVEYQSDLVCARDSGECPWTRLEQQAAFSVLVNCLLDGVNVIQSEHTGLRTGGADDMVAPLPPKYGYARIAVEDEAHCSQRQAACKVTSRVDRELTRATCGTQSLGTERLRGGDSPSVADEISDSAIVTGSLAKAADEFGLDGPDHYYSFTINAKIRLETLVAANSSQRSLTLGYRSAWQPALYLLAADGRQLDDGQVLRGGVTYLFPRDLEPGRYYLVVDSSQREFIRGDGMYRLYVGFDRSHMGPVAAR